MSRIGKAPIPLPDEVDVEIHADRLEVSGPRGETTSKVPDGVRFVLEDGTLIAQRVGRGKRARACWGLARALANNAVIGVTEGYEKELEIHGIGYRANLQGDVLTLQLGFSHPVEFPVPEGIDIEVEEQTRLFVRGVDKQQVSEIAAQIRGLRPPDVYKAKGIRYVDEVIHKKVGKAAVTTTAP